MKRSDNYLDTRRPVCRAYSCKGALVHALAPERSGFRLGHRKDVQSPGDPLKELRAWPGGTARSWTKNGEGRFWRQASVAVCGLCRRTKGRAARPRPRPLPHVGAKNDGFRGEELRTWGARQGLSPPAVPPVLGGSCCRDGASGHSESLPKSIASNEAPPNTTRRSEAEPR
jgi:hypothetical protein